MGHQKKALKILQMDLINIFCNLGKIINNNIGQTTQSPGTYINKTVPQSLFFTPINEQEILNIVSDKKSKSSCGFDLVPPTILKYTIDSIIKPLTYLMNLSLLSGIFPQKMKIAKVIPIFKSQEKSQFSNYRPISLLPIFSKILEKLVHNRLYDFCNKFNLITPSQYGFRKNFSTEHAVIEFQNKIIECLKNKTYAVGIFMDLSKAFDSISHEILIKKLYNYGIRGICLKWFESYLYQRSQYVYINEHSSSKRFISCGIPQGSILGPLIFLIYINDICNCSPSSNFIMYADDTNIIISDKNLIQLEYTINDELIKVNNWLKANKLLLNVNKTKYMLFIPNINKKNSNQGAINLNIIINNVSIDRVDTHKFLGIFVDEELNWKTHVDKIATQISRTIGIMYKLKHFIPRKVLRLIYLSLIQSHLMYGISVWRSIDSSNCNRLITLQKKAIRIVSGTKYNSHTDPLFKKENLLKLDDLYKLCCIKLYCLFLQNKCPLFIKKSVNIKKNIYCTRQSYDVYKSRVKSKYDKQLLNYKIGETWNKLPLSIQAKVNSSLQYSFNKLVKQFLISAYYENCHIINCYFL